MSHILQAWNSLISSHVTCSYKKREQVLFFINWLFIRSIALKDCLNTKLTNLRWKFQWPIQSQNSPTQLVPGFVGARSHIFCIMIRPLLIALCKPPSRLKHLFWDTLYCSVYTKAVTTCAYMKVCWILYITIVLFFNEFVVLKVVLYLCFMYQTPRWFCIIFGDIMLSEL